MTGYRQVEAKVTLVVAVAVRVSQWVEGQVVVRAEGEVVWPQVLVASAKQRVAVIQLGSAILDLVSKVLRSGSGA